MRRNVLMAGALALVLAVPAANAQDKPNFSGTWNRVTDPNAAPTGGRGGGRGGIGMTATITQDAKTLTITRTTQNGEVKTVYNLDGSDSKNMAGRAGQQTEQVSNAKWDGNKLVITTKTANGDRVSSWYLEGGELVQETQGQNGAVKIYYKKG